MYLPIRVVSIVIRSAEPARRLVNRTRPEPVRVVVSIQIPLVARWPAERAYIVLAAIRIEARLIADRRVIAPVETKRGLQNPGAHRRPEDGPQKPLALRFCKPVLDKDALEERSERRCHDWHGSCY